MAKSTTNVVRHEKWVVAEKPGSTRKISVEKVAVRNHLGQFHGATNFKGSVLR